MRQRVTVKNAALEIGCSEALLKARMRRKEWDLGFVEGDYRKTYYIFREKLDRFLGKEKREE